MTTIIRLPFSEFPWRYALRVDGVESDVFHKFIDALKMNIAPHERKWSVEYRCWLLRDCDIVIALLRKFAIAYNFDGEQHKQPEPSCTKLTTADAYRTFYLTPDAPAFVIEAVYRALVKKHHPDAGGDTAVMQRINSAMEVLR